MAEITNFRGEAQIVEQTAPIDLVVNQLILRVGDRVRKARERRGIPRRVLSEMSGVSPRYLAQLETGEGNISIALLQRIAVALDHKIEWFVGEDDPWTSDALRVADLYRQSNGQIQQSVLQLLNPVMPGRKKTRRICLLGLRGAGKSTLGTIVSARLGVPFLELNREIEEHSGMPVNEVIALYGQEGYRKLEEQAVQRVIAIHDTLILAVAGGVVGDPLAYNTLLNGFHTIWIKASPEEHMSRVRAQGDERPMIGNPEAMDQLKALLASREAMYDRATVKLDTSGKTLEQSTCDLMTLIEAQQFLA